MKNSKLDCEYETMLIVKDKNRELELVNADNRKRITHNLEAYVEIQISEEFTTQIKNF